MPLDINGSNALIFDNSIYVSNGTIIIKYGPDINILSQIDLLYNIVDIACKPPYIYVVGSYDITVLDSNLNIISSYHNDTLNPFENFLIAKNENSIFVANRYSTFKVNMDTLTIAWNVAYPVCYGSSAYNTLSPTTSLDDTDNFYTSIQRYDTCSRYRIFQSNGTIKRDIGYNVAGNNYAEPIILNETHYFIGLNLGSGGTGQKPIYGYNRTTDAREYILQVDKFHYCMFYDNNRIYTCSADSGAFGFYNLADLSFTSLGSAPQAFISYSLITASTSTIYVGILSYNPYGGGSSGNNILYNFGDTSSNISSNNAGFKIAIGKNYIHSPIEFYNGGINYLNKQDSYNGIFPYNIAILNMGNNVLRLIYEEGCITFQSDPTGAEIFTGSSPDNLVDSTLNTPNTLCIRTGTIYYKLTLSGYQDYEGSLILKANDSITLSTTLVPVTQAGFGSLQIISVPSNSKIYIDGVLMAKSPSIVADIPVGSHDIIVKLPGYNDYTSTITIFDNITTSVYIELIIKLGNISFDSIPRGARITLDGTDTGNMTPYIVQNIIEGVHSYDLTLDSYNTYTCLLKVLGSQTTYIDPQLTPIEGCIYIDSCPQSEVIIDDVDTGSKTPYSSCGYTGHHKITLSLVGYDDYIEEIDMPIGGGINRFINLNQKLSVPFTDVSKEVCSTSGVTYTTYTPVPLDDNTYAGKPTLISAGYNIQIIDANGYGALWLRAFVSKPNIQLGAGGSLNIYHVDTLNPSDCSAIPAGADTLLSASNYDYWYFNSLFFGALNISKRYIIFETSTTNSGNYAQIYMMGAIVPTCIPIQSTICELINIVLSITANPIQIKSLETSQITVHAEDEFGSSIEGADINILSEGISLPTSGTTDANGNFISVYTAPVVGSDQLLTISATISKVGYLAVSGSAQITVISILVTVEISPSTVNVPVGSSQQFIATCRDQNNTEITCPEITWNVLDPTIGSISQTGLFTGISNGQTTITATVGNISGSATVSVLPVFTSIDIVPSTVNVPIDGTQQFVATCRDQNNIQMDCPSLTWSSSDITKGTISDTGLFTGTAIGTTTITATNGSISGSSIVTVIPVVVQAGFNTAGMLLLGGLLIGASLFRKKCGDNKTRDECIRAGCKWINGQCTKKV